MATSVTSAGITFPDSTSQTTAAQSEFASGTVMLFQQTSAPTGWTKGSTHNNKAIRVVTGTVGTGGNSAFTTAFASYTPAGNVSVSGSVSMSGNIGATTLTTTQMPSHAHGLRFFQGNEFATSNANGIVSGNGTGGRGNSSTNNSYMQNTGGGGSHNHSHNLSGSLSVNSSTFSGSAKDLAVQYVDTIIATKD